MTDPAPTPPAGRVWLRRPVGIALSAVAVAVVLAVAVIVALLGGGRSAAPAAQTVPSPRSSGPATPDPSASLDPSASPSSPGPSASATPDGSVDTPVPGPVTGYAVSAYGDSVMLGAVSAMHNVMPNAYISAVGSRQIDAMAASIRTAKANGSLAPIVVIHAGTNGFQGLLSAYYPQLLDDLSDRRLVVILTVKVSGSGNANRIAANNGIIWSVASSHANVVVADWYGYSLSHDEWFSDLPELTHLSPAGAIAYANLIAARVASAPPPVDPSPDPQPSEEPSETPSQDPS